MALFFAALPRADIDFEADFRPAAFRPAFFVAAALRVAAAFRLVALRPLDFAAFRPALLDRLLVPLAAPAALCAAAVPRRAAVVT